ncbi:SDR family oxidoreductase [Streptomyces sp. MC1]|nr:SDR family oxidoreductase [Streptomyces sp. MC1]
MHEEGSLVGSLANKNALVTGASRGIGRAIAERLGREGALVAVHYGHDAAAARGVVTSIRESGGQAFAVRAELAMPSASDELSAGLLPALKEHSGREEIDILVNNAGITGGTAFDRTSQDVFHRVTAVNAKAPLFILQRLLPHIPDGARIVNVTSALTRSANPDEIVYAMSKGALEQLTLHLAQLLGPRGITVNSVVPGSGGQASAVFSRASALGRAGRPQDVADVVAFLASEDARWITGTSVDATGGALLGR